MNAGVCIGGPKDGEDIAYRHHQMVFPRMLTLPPIYDAGLVYDDQVDITNDTYHWFRLSKDQGFWLHSEMSAYEAIKRLLDSYPRKTP